MPSSISAQQTLLKPQKECRICRSPNLVKYFDFGEMPLANRNLSFFELNTEEPVFPLQLLLCRDCKLSQLSQVVSSQWLYQEYPYFSSVSMTFQDHCREMVERLQKRLQLRTNDLVVEIASNDGCLLSKFKEAGFKIAGVEPAQNLASHANANGFRTFCHFWGQDIAAQIKGQLGSPGLIIGTNVLAHVDDLNEFLSAVRMILHEEGYFVFEVPYMANYIEQLEFDTTYHEHLSYFLLNPLKRLLEKNGFRIIDVERFKIHGGTIRVICCKDSASHAESANVGKFLALEKEMGLLDEEIYFKFEARILFIRNEIRQVLSSLRKKSKYIAAYGASAKGNVLLNYCGIGKETIGYIVDDTPAKQGKFQSGTHIPIVGADQMLRRRPDYLLILAWNFSEELIKKTTEYQRSGGNYIIPLPRVNIIESTVSASAGASFL